ncbi:MAG: ATP-dependent DNA helicase [Candidatus Saccharimonadales bacterium]
MGASESVVFKATYSKLNAAQKQAVDSIDGPLLVIAGPGTGKTQLLSARVANILQKTDSLPQNILCLTFTENGALNMRERLTRFIGQAAYDVTISTYHAFGADILRRFPQYFTEYRLENPIDELGKHQIVSTIVENMSYINPLKQTRHHLGDLIATISEIKRALLSSDDLRAIANENIKFLLAVNVAMKPLFAGFTRMPGTFAKSSVPFTELMHILNEHTPAQAANKRFGSLAEIAADSLAAALFEAEETNKSKPLTAWKNQWLAKNEDNEFIMDGALANARIAALADVFEAYQAALETSGLYDFDDMIIRAIHALQTHDDLKYTLQEQYLYLLLDEFQDTNAAQLQLVALLTDNPVNNGRPNVMAVGDDDQAIYAFQGAQYSNMMDFYELYQGVKVVSLTENYRSHADIISTAGNIAAQIDARLEHNFDNVSKELVAKNNALPKTAAISRNDFLSPMAQYDWTAKQIAKLIKQGTHPREIAVLAPRHKHLEPLVRYLNAEHIPVRYEKRENLLEAPVVAELITMSRLVLALSRHDDTTANGLWPEVISFDFWELPTSAIWQLSWATRDSDERTNWSKAMLEHEAFRIPALLFLTLAHKVSTETLETMLDYLIGSEVADTNEPDLPKVASPLRDFYMSPEMQEKNPELFYETLSHLSVLRAKLRAYQTNSEHTLGLQDFLNFVNEYQAAETPIINTSPYNQQADAVQLMTVFKAKGLEFEHVFLPSNLDDVWGSTSRRNSNKLTLPPNLAPIRHAGATDDERLRLLFVAITRAKQGLYLTSYQADFAGRLGKRLKYLDEREQEDGNFKALVLPEAFQDVTVSDQSSPSLDVLQLDWRARHVKGLQQANLRNLLEERLNNYQLSPTHLTTFIDLEYGGPERFFFNTLLRFPEAPGLDGQFGNAIHETLEWLQYQVTEKGTLPATNAIDTQFEANLKAKKILESQFPLQLERGTRALAVFVKKYGHTYKPTDKAEVNFRNENVFVGAAHLSGKIDRMEIDKANKTITVIDYKTGKTYEKWESIPKLHKYRLQLYCYKLLIEKSRSFAGYKVTSGRLMFVEPDSSGRVHSLELNFKDDEVAETEKLLQALWKHVHELSFPDVNEYDANLKGIRAFEQDLLSGTK